MQRRLSFFDDAGFVCGKSVDIHSRVGQHLSEGRKPGRHQRLMSQVKSIDCNLTAGDLGALLIENAAIKAEVPLFNRRQRQLRRLWTIQLNAANDGFLKPAALDFAPTKTETRTHLGCSPISSALHHYTESSDHVVSQSNGIGIEAKGPASASASAATAPVRGGVTSHNARLLEHLDRQRIAAWPFAGPILLSRKPFNPSMTKYAAIPPGRSVGMAWLF